VRRPTGTQQNDTFVAIWVVLQKGTLGIIAAIQSRLLFDEVVQWAPIEPAEFQQLHGIYPPFTGLAF
jgi:hypothetical protein